jgi:hypothetical protein
MMKKKALFFIILFSSIFYVLFNTISLDQSAVIEDFDLEFAAKILRPRYAVNCKRIFQMDKLEIEKAKTLKNTTFMTLKDSNFIFPETKCKSFRSILGYDRISVSQSSQNFPLAFTILMHENVEQLERFIRSIYQPQNVYCIHVDEKAERLTHQAVESIAKCFDNVFISTQLEDVVYAGYSRLKADVNCLTDLLKLDSLVNKHKNLLNKKIVEWKYAYNLVGSEFLLRTNDELVELLKVYNGSNEIGVVKSFNLDYRVKRKWVEDRVSYKMVRTSQLNSKPPHGYRLTKSLANYLITKKFAEYAVFDPWAIDLLEWSKDTYSPDEW